MSDARAAHHAVELFAAHPNVGLVNDEPRGPTVQFDEVADVLPVQAQGLRRGGFQEE